MDDESKANYRQKSEASDVSPSSHSPTHQKSVRNSGFITLCLLTRDYSSDCLSLICTRIN